MNLWTMIFLIVAICVIGDIIKSRGKTDLNESIKTCDDLTRLLGRLTKRVENLETIVLERERTSRFTGVD